MNDPSIVQPIEGIQLSIEELQLIASLLIIQNLSNRGFFIDIEKTINKVILPSNKLIPEMFKTGIPKDSFHNF